MKIGIDVDNCLNDFARGLISFNNIYNNENLTIEDIKSYDIHKHVKCGEEIYEYIDLPDFFTSLNPLPYSQEVTKRLVEQHELYFVTATYPNHVMDKASWLMLHFPHIPIENLIVTQHKNLVNVDLLIDDHIHNIVHFPNHTILFDYAWNRNFNTRYRAKNWLEIEKIIDEISG